MRNKSKVLKIKLYVLLYLTFASSLVAQTVWVAPAMSRISKFGAMPTADTDVQLYAAKGEYEGFQVIVKADSALNNLNLSASALEGVTTIGLDNVNIYKAQFVNLHSNTPSDENSAQPSLSPGLVADPLIPISLSAGQSASLVAGQTGSYFVDVFVPRDTPAGDYTGSIVVTSSAGTKLVSINLKVWDFALPLKGKLKTSFGIRAKRPAKTAKLLLEHRMSPRIIGNADQRELIDNYGLQLIDANIWAGANYSTCSMLPAPRQKFFKREKRFYESDLLVYNYTADEITRCRGLLRPMRTWAKRLRRAGMDNLVVMVPKKRFERLVDLWVVLPGEYVDFNQRIQRVLDKGDQVWLYTALNQDPRAPQWQIDFLPIEHRILIGFLNKSIGSTGFLYWAVDYKTTRKKFDAWENIYPFPEFPGDGLLVYPGKKVDSSTPIPSLRLKWIRDGIEDYEYLALLEDLGHNDFLSQKMNQVATGLDSWTKDQDLLMGVRKDIGEFLSAQ